MNPDEFQKQYFEMNGELGDNNTDLFSQINSFRTWESLNKTHGLQQIIYLYNHEIDFDYIKWFYIFYSSCTSKNVDNVKLCLDQLKVLAQLTIFEKFDEFFDNNLPIMFVQLLLTDDIDIQKKFILFMTELGKSSEQELFEPIAKCSLFENIINLAEDTTDISLLLIILEFFQASLANFECVRTEILRKEFLDFLKYIILNQFNLKINSKETISLAKLAIQILSDLSQCPNLSSIQISQICDFFVPFFKNSRSEIFWNDMLTIIRSIIKRNDESMYQYIISKYQQICLELLMKNKNVAIVTNSILILNFYYYCTSSSIQIVETEDQAQRLISLSKKKNNSLSRAALQIIGNIMKTDVFYFDYFLSNNIVPIIISKFENEYKLKTKFEAASIMSLIVMNGTIEQQILSVQSDFIHYYLETASIDIEKFVATAIPPLMKLLELGTTNPEFSYIWDLFDGEDGFQIISDLSFSADETIAKNIISVIDDITEMRESLEL